MHLSINFGLASTSLAYYDDNNNLIKMEKNSLLVVNAEDISFEIFSYIKEKYPAPFALESVSIALPILANLNLKNNILNWAKQVFLVKAIYLLPSSVAAIIAYNINNYNFLNSGEILYISSTAKDSLFTIIDIFNGQKEILIEKQCKGKTSDLLEEASILNIYNNEQWHWSYVFLAANEIDNNNKLISTLCENIISLTPQEENMYVLTGSMVFSKSTTNIIKIIYPYHFYFKISDNNWYRIPFDTDNLEINIHGKYKIFSCKRENSFNLSKNDNIIEMEIYEVPSKNTPEEFSMCSEIQAVLHINKSAAELPPVLDFYLDLYNSSLKLELKNEEQANSVFDKNEFWTVINYKKIKQFTSIENIQEIEPQLYKNYMIEIEKLKKNERHTYREHFTTTMYKLSSLLQFWYEKQ